MKRTTIVAPEAVLERLRTLARDRGVSFSEIVREALDQKAAEYRPKPTFLGIASSGRTDIASTEATEPAPPEPWH
ncbi:MAG: CopG family transcriptional regulator [Actinomycetota bacterium]